VEQHRFSDVSNLRTCWYTNHLPNGRPLTLSRPEIQGHRLAWALFLARQIQRTIIEGFLRCFELAVKSGGRTIAEILAYWQDRSPPDAAPVFAGTFEDLVRTEAAPVSRARDFLTVSRRWQAKVHGNHALYEDRNVRTEEETLDDVSDGDGTEPAMEGGELVNGLRMLARWWIRMQVWLQENVRPDLLEAGQRYRMSLHWFCDWIRPRLTTSISDLMTALFSEVVFAQHINVALGRFDGKVQRLRFILGDEGIAPTLEARGDLGRYPLRTADRLNAFIGILCDVGILGRGDDGVYSVGPHWPYLSGCGLGPGAVGRPARP
jgi:hypothetical protein